jgi:peptidoglycan/LPS O-acetylase OafA/YrhL
MHRRTLGSGRRLAIIGALLLVAGSLLPWYAIGGDNGLPQLTLRAFETGSGVLAFLAGMATLALVTLPYAMGERPVSVDRGIAYWLLAVVAVIGVALWIPTALTAPEGLLPDRAPGFWLAVVGSLVLARGAFEVGREPPRR